MQSKGYGIITSPAAPVKEIDTFTCPHCNRLVICRSSAPEIKVDAGGFCRLCYANICGPCADKGVCDPFEEKLKRAERKDQFRRELGVD